MKGALYVVELMPGMGASLVLLAFSLVDDLEAKEEGRQVTYTQLAGKVMIANTFTGRW